ncbi:MAG: hypothetical protein ACLR1T_07615 [Evtepia gabavorous]
MICVPMDMPAAWPLPGSSRAAGAAAPDVCGYEDGALSRHPGGAPPVEACPGRAAFRLCHGTTGKAILDRGELEWDEVV